MGRFVDRVRLLALAWGAPGLFVVALLDSAFLPLPGITDLLLVVLVTRHKEAVLLYVGAAALGSIAGSLVMHSIGRKGGEALVRKRFAGPKVESAMATLQRYGVVSVLIPCLLPPPAPFKIFVLLAGAIGISAARFAAAIALGRGIRYLALGFLAVEFGDRASVYIAENGAAVSLAAAAAVAAGLAAYLVWSKARGARNR